MYCLIDSFSSCHFSSTPDFPRALTVVSSTDKAAVVNPSEEGVALLNRCFVYLSTLFESVGVGSLLKIRPVATDLISIESLEQIGVTWVPFQEKKDQYVILEFCGITERMIVHSKRSHSSQTKVTIVITIVCIGIFFFRFFDFFPLLFIVVFLHFSTSVYC